ncbi:translin-associated factor X-interacting protein 1-like [Athalia rosae]|uniref:translin-associated factor X-interacting protein 1-like n=1 Tax=Athalia rosae TaxID=37344 RepID=UPI00203353DC|nr:translin-associated factor X-interacting protein 1-like [Athalia rosae]
MMFDSSLNVLQSRRKIGVNEVLVKLERVKIQHQILRPPKSSIVPGCKIKRNQFSGNGKNHKFSLNKPVFIKNIEFSIESELKSKAETSECNNTNCDHLLCHQDHLDVELTVYRKAFDALLNKIMTFKPLLKRIKYIYDKSIEVRDDRIKLMDVLSSKLESYKESIERKVETIQRTGLVEARHLKIENADLIRTIAELKLNLEERTDMVKSLRNDILELEEREIGRIVNGQRTTPRMTETDNQTEAVPKTDQISVARRLVDDPVLMSTCLQRARKDLSSAHKRLAEFEDTFREVVPKRDLERLEIRYQVIEREYRDLSQELETLMKEHEILKKRFEAVKEQKNSLRDRCKILAHTNTPRPDWSKYNKH